MRKSDFYYHLPQERIAQHPAVPRSASRLLHMEREGGACHDLYFTDLPDLLHAGDLLVFNDTRVLPARLFGVKDSGGRIEALIERLRDQHRACVQLRASKPPRPGQKLIFDGSVEATVDRRDGEFYELTFAGDEPLAQILERIGHMPLPPYIDRHDATADRERYQTVYARAPGAVAAPTAGLHFDEPILAQLKDKGVESAFVTLHVGAGTFQPLRVENIHEHRMHTEYLTVDERACDQINTAKREGRRIVAIGTTVVRVLETVAQNGRVTPYKGETEIFIIPGCRFQIVDALLTNFHLPESTLLMLVCAFGGTERALNAYRHAVEKKYRFYSYGDAMFISDTD